MPLLSEQNRRKRNVVIIASFLVLIGSAAAFDLGVFAPELPVASNIVIFALFNLNLIVFLLLLVLLFRNLAKVWFERKQNVIGARFRAKLVLAFLAQTSAQKGVVWWASHHRWHHKYSDTPEDIHSARLRGFWYSHIGWILGSAVASASRGSAMVRSSRARSSELMLLSCSSSNTQPPPARAHRPDTGGSIRCRGINPPLPPGPHLSRQIQSPGRPEKIAADRCGAPWPGTPHRPVAVADGIRFRARGPPGTAAITRAAGPLRARDQPRNQLSGVSPAALSTYALAPSSRPAARSATASATCSAVSSGPRRARNSSTDSPLRSA
jgi:hypothetical protein